jgi:hypothetical protein
MGSVKRRGSAIIAVLLVSTLLLVLGMGMLSQKASLYESASRDRSAAQARGIAQAGMVDCQIKLSKHREFPPKRAREAKAFTYSELFTDNAAQPLGTYTVTIDTTRAASPYAIYQVTCVGLLGDPEDPQARYEIYGEYDISRTMRDDPALANPDYRKWVHFVEQSIPIEPVIVSDDGAS